MSEAEIPIDIAVRKLLDWLVSRRIVNRNWHEGVTSIRCEKELMDKLVSSSLFQGKDWRGSW